MASTDTGNTDLTLAIQRFNIRGYLEQKGAQQAGSDEWLLTCPRCGKEKLTVNPRERKWRCFSCERYAVVGSKKWALSGAGGVFGLVEWLEGMSRRDTARYLLDQAQRLESLAGPIAVEFSKPVRADLRHPTGLPENCVAPTGILPYMARRRITLEDARVFGIGYVPVESGGWLANRLVFPVWEAGVCLYWQARAMWDKHEHRPRWKGDDYRKSLNPALEKHGVRYLGATDVVGNLEQAARYPRVCLVEGPTSGVQVGPDAAWTFGKHVHPAQVARLVRYGVREVDLMFDGPSPTEPYGAWEQMLEAAAILAPYMKVNLIYIPQGDPGQRTKQENAEIRRACARPYNEVHAWRL